MKRHTLSLIAAFIACAGLSSCSDTGGFFGDDDKGKVLKYYSAEEPGRWAAQAVDHDLNVAVIEDAKKKKAIEVSVPFTNERSEQHYVEVLLLADSNGKELDKKLFKRGDKAHAIFTMTDKMTFPVFVMGRCNMHDWWRKKVTGEEKAGE